MKMCRAVMTRSLIVTALLLDASHCHGSDASAARTAATAAFGIFSTKTGKKSPSASSTAPPSLSSARKRGVGNTAPPPPPPQDEFGQALSMPKMELPDMTDLNLITPNAWNKMTSSLLGAAAKLAPKQTVQNSEKSARIQLRQLPPDSFEIDLNDVPIIGSALSGKYAKVKQLTSDPSVTIASPKDKLGAAQVAADDGRLQFGLSGLFQSFVDVRLEPNRPGVAPVEVQSPLIPRWPFGRRSSDWNKVVNMGNGDVYYFNSKTGETTRDKPTQV